MNPYKNASISLLILVFVSFWGNVSAQVYTPLVADEATWVIAHSPDILSDVDYYAFRIEGDTLINQQLYAQVYRYDLEDNKTNPYIVLTKQLYSFLREDTLARAVYVKYVADNGLIYNDQLTCFESSQEEEVLLLDFAKSIGDILTDCVLVDEDYGTEVVDVYESELYGMSRRSFETQSALRLIEGIGYDDGLFVPAESAVSAAKQHSMVDFCIGTIDECGLLTSNNNVLFDESLEIYPNPTSDIVMIRSDKEIIEVQLINAMGQVIVQSHSSNIDLSIYADGVYYFNILYKEGKIIKRVTKF